MNNKLAHENEIKELEKDLKEEEEEEEDQDQDSFVNSLLIVRGGEHPYL